MSPCFKALNSVGTVFADPALEGSPEGERNKQVRGSDAMGGRGAAGRNQQAMLHQTLLSIGAEVDENKLSRDNAFAENSRAVSSTCRRRLRNHVSTFTDVEENSLLTMVKAREVEVKKLGVQVGHLENMVESARSNAGIGRTSRKQSETAKELVPGLQSSRENHAQENNTSVEEWYEKVKGLSEEEKKLAEECGTMNKDLRQLITKRKIVEATLFSVHAQVLRLRARAEKEERRAQQLANELMKVVRGLPKAIHDKLADFASGYERCCDDQMRYYVWHYQAQRFKYKDHEALQETMRMWKRRVTDIETCHHIAEDVVKGCKALASDLSLESPTLEDALNSLAGTWKHLSSDAATRRVTDLKMRSAAKKWDVFDNAQDLVIKAMQSAVAIKEMLRILNES